MTDIAGLCERLWSGCIYMRDSNTNCVVNREETDALLAETADTLERQAAEIERLRGALEEARIIVFDATMEDRYPSLAVEIFAQIDAILTGEDAGGAG